MSGLRLPPRPAASAAAREPAERQPAAGSQSDAAGS